MKQNIIWIFGDQHRAQALGYMGDPNARTPNIDRMADEGVTFTDAVAGCPWCTPFRGALLTSRYIHSVVQRTPQKCDPELPMVSDSFNSHGYRTAYFGKWHLFGGPNDGCVSKEERGRFDIWLGYENNNAQYDCHVHGHDLDGRDDTDSRAEKLEIYETDALTNRLISFLEQRGHEQPFFAVLSVQPPHDPHVAPPEYEERYDPDALELRPNVPDIPRITERTRKDLAGYYAQIENLDWNVGRVFESLKANGLDEDTHVAFFSDHGDMHGSHGYIRKSSPWEESVCIPCIWRPAGGGQSKTSNAPFNHVDFAPTSLGMCGLDIEDWMEGTDFSHHIIEGRKPPDEEPQSAYLQHCFRKRFDCLNRVWRGIRTNDGWKYVCLEHQPVMLFNLNEDPYELTNLAYLDTHNEKREELQAELADWIEKTGDEFPLPEL
ncbi:MAG: sulfatase [Planctomycetota bacterium]|jgi:arylsulfatase A-like enzyme|nr:sulfatase [Planctomycetota bacterium]